MAAASTGDYWVQIGALSNVEHAQRWAQRLSQQFGVPGKVAASSQAVQLQQRLSSEAQRHSFIIVDL
ncbi:MAG: hypothetical protein G5700_06650 [Serratia symbiotica]|nr:hypothetical protein [Serratia symbiotica]